MKQYTTYPVHALLFDGDDGSGVEQLSDLLREVADWLDDDQAAARPGDNRSYDLSVTLEEGMYTALLYVFNDGA